jgi:hypothetical protein
MMGGSFSAPFPMQVYPAAQPMNQFMPPIAQPGARVPTAPYAPVIAQQQVPSRPIIRAQREDDPPPVRPSRIAPPPARLTIPTPEQLGVAGAMARSEASVDWSAVHDKLNRLGASCFHLEKLSNGACRITCLLPTGQEGRSRRIEAEAGSEAEAVRAALARAEEWSNAR